MTPGTIVAFVIAFDPDTCNPEFSDLKIVLHIVESSSPCRRKGLASMNLGLSAKRRPVPRALAMQDREPGEGGAIAVQLLALDLDLRAMQPRTVGKGHR